MSPALDCQPTYELTEAEASGFPDVPMSRRSFRRHHIDHLQVLSRGRVDDAYFARNVIVYELERVASHQQEGVIPNGR